MPMYLKCLFKLGLFLLYTHYRRTFNSFLKRKNWIKTRGVSLLHIGAGVLPVLTAGYLLQYIIKGYLFGPIPVIVGLVRPLREAC